MPVFKHIEHDSMMRRGAVLRVGRGARGQQAANAKSAAAISRLLRTDFSRYFISKQCVIMSKRTYKSGASKRKAMKDAEQDLEKIPKLSTYFAPQTNLHVCIQEEEYHETDSFKSKDSFSEENRSVASETQGEASCSTINPTVTYIPVADRKEVTEFEPLTADPGDWPSFISDKQVSYIVAQLARGPPQQNESYEFPFNKERRRFTGTHFYRRMSNGEKIRRSWLMYSVHKDSIYCFCCKLFGTGDTPLRLGTSAWKAMSKRLLQHETGKSHQDCMAKWFDLRSGIVNRTSIDQVEMQAFLKEKDFWRNVVKRMVDVVIFLSERNLAFRGNSEKLGDPSNGNFLGLVEFLAKYDNVLSELLQRIKKAETHVQYLSPQIQNELIQLVASNIQKANIEQLKKAKYYSVILDCTPDVSHEEQMSMVLRYVECNSEDGVTIHESFFGFINVHDTTGEGLLEALLEKANKLGIDIADMRGQAYDNGANMSGKNKGVQARMLEINDRALYVPCGAHTWNLVISDAAKSSKYAVDFFGLINRIYTIFSSSPSRWDILQEHMPISVKRLTDTRWESRIEALKPLRYNLAELCNAFSSLREYALEKRDGNTATEASALLDHISTWPFVLTICIWYDILFQVNKTSKLIQSPDVSLDVLQTEVGATKKFFEDFRNTGYNSAATNAREIAEDMGIERVFPVTRERRKCKMFNYECSDESSRLSPEEKYKSEFFLVLTDQAIFSVSSRFDQLVEWYKLFGFLCTAKSLKQCYKDNELETHCKNFERQMGDIDANELTMELKRFIYVIEKEPELATAKDFLKYIWKNILQEIYPNLCICIRILLTLPVTVASAERSFSRLKLIKNILRSKMTDERLSALAIISIENSIARSLDYDALIDEFAENKVRKKRFS